MPALHGLFGVPEGRMAPSVLTRPPQTNNNGEPNCDRLRVPDVSDTRSWRNGGREVPQQGQAAEREYDIDKASRTVLAVDFLGAEYPTVRLHNSCPG